MGTQSQWTGHEARQLRIALRLSVRAFAARLGIAERTVSKWEKAGRDITPWPDSQALLDTCLAQAPDDAQARFAQLVDESARHRTTISDQKRADRVVSPSPAVWPADSAGVRAAVAALWTREPDDAPVDQSLQTASHSVVFTWLLAQADSDLAELPAHDNSGQVTRDDVAALLAMKRSLAALDHEHGGGAGLPLIVSYLAREVTPLLHGRYQEQVGRALFAAAAELAMLAGVMAYDVGQHGHARQQMLHALRLSQVADDRLFGGRVLTVMSHQARTLGHLQDGIDFAAAATRGANAVGAPAAVALFAVTEALARASSGDRQASLPLMHAAERALDQADAVERPEWLLFLDGGELTSKLGRCFRDLGMHREAERHLELSLSLHKPHRRKSHALTKIVLATNYVRQGELEPACQLGQEALPEIGRLRSWLTKEYLTELYRELAHYEREPLVQDFREQAKHLVVSSTT